MNKFIIPQSQTIKPLRQGQLDTLCGLYSTINAIRIAAYPQRKLTKVHARELMKEGIDFLDIHKPTLNLCLSYGMSNWRRKALVKHLIKHVWYEWGVPLERSKPYLKRLENPHSVLMRFIEGNIKAKNPVCIEINGHYHHYTVVSGYNVRSFYLFDSDGLSSIRRDLINIKGDEEEKRHELIPKGVFALRLSNW